MADPETGERRPRSTPVEPPPGTQAGDWLRSDFGKQVRNALLHLYDVPYLQTHPLTQWVHGEMGARAPGAGLALQRELRDVIAAVGPRAGPSNMRGLSPRGPRGGSAERTHAILMARYVEALPAPEVQARLAIGKSEYYREHQRAVHAVISLLADRWGLDERIGPLPGGQDDRPALAPVPLTFNPVLRRPDRPPVPLTGLLGRQRELTAINRILRKARLLTLTGPPGTGKTRVALEVAVGAADAFPDGAYFVPLAAIADPSLVLPTIARALGVVPNSERPLTHSIAEAVGERKILLVLDNFEQILSAATEVVELLQGARQLKALVTSRSPLHVRGEHEYPVGPLAVPPAGRRVDHRQIASYPSMVLFVERTREVQHDFTLTDDTATAVAEICRRLDGLPLAIELAAARSKLLPPQAMLSRLEHRLPLLTKGAQDLPARHQTLRAALAWSHDLLENEDQVLLRRLAVFVGGCTLEATEAVAREGIALPALDGIGSLLDKSLLRQEEQRDGEPRFLMLETVREYGLEQLEATGEADMLRRRHADFFTGLAEQQNIPGHESNPAASWLDRMERDHANLRAAMEWLIGIGDAAAALRLAFGMRHFWRLHGHFAEGRALVTRALALPRVPEATPRNRTAALGTLGEMAMLQGDLNTARTAWEEVLEQHQQRGTEHGIHVALVHLANIHLGLGQPAAARDFVDRSLVSLRAAGEGDDDPFACGLYGRAALLEGDVIAARRHYEEGIALARSRGDRNMMVGLTMGLGEVAQREGNPIEARACYKESLPIAAELGNRRAIAEQLEQLASIATPEGRPRDVLRLIAAARTLREEIGVPASFADEDRVQQIVVRAEQALDERERAAAWAEGRALTLEQAVAFALATPAQ